jgi:hypoxanthine-guanine phosphoribosyltransferase
MPGYTLRPLFSAQQIQKRVQEMGAQIGADYPRREPAPGLHLEGRMLFPG